VIYSYIASKLILLLRECFAAREAVSFSSSLLQQFHMRLAAYIGIRHMG
jgi:hypothetical protein